MTKDERLNWLKQIEKDIEVCSLDATFEETAKSCAIRSAIEELEQRKTGRWSINEVGVVRCPFCHANMNPRKNRKPKYCDECGARMEGADDAKS